MIKTLIYLIFFLVLLGSFLYVPNKNELTNTEVFEKTEEEILLETKEVIKIDIDKNKELSANTDNLNKEKESQVIRENTAPAKLNKETLDGNNNEIPISSINLPITSSECEKIKSANPFYWDSKIQAVSVEEDLRSNGMIDEANKLRAISCIPQSIWIFGNDEHSTNKKINLVINNAEDKIPVFVIYNKAMPNKLEWGTNIENGDEYVKWIGEITEKIKNTNGWIILEPDALALSHGLSEQDRLIRINELRGAVEKIKTIAPNINLYIDAGNSSWNPEWITADYLNKAGVKIADGFSLNISSFQFSHEEEKYGLKVSRLTNNSHFVIDTSRNGNGQSDNPTWCNPPNRALGKNPTQNTNNPIIDAFLWVKPPGESDGACNGGPSAGIFWLEYALELIDNAYIN